MCISLLSPLIILFVPNEIHYICDNIMQKNNVEIKGNKKKGYQSERNKSRIKEIILCQSKTPIAGKK